MILITGATGTIGSEVLRLLADSDTKVRAMTRDPSRIAQPVDVARADFDDADSLRRAVSGVDTVFLLTAPDSPTPRHDLALLDVARELGVRKVVKLSAIGTGERVGGKVVGTSHRQAEQALQESGLDWTVLRPSSFASNFLRWTEMVKAGAPIPNLTGAGVQGIVDPRDVAAVTVRTLTEDVHSGQTYTLTGPQPLSVRDQATQLAEVLGTPVDTVDVPLEQARQQMLGSGMGEALVDAIVTGSAWVLEGRNDIVTDDVPTILGRPATQFRAWAQDFSPRFR